MNKKTRVVTYSTTQMQRRTRLRLATRDLSIRTRQ